MSTGAQQAPPELGDDLLASCDAAGAVVWLLDLQEDRMLFVSGAYERIWGRPHDEFMADHRAWESGVHADDLPRVRQAVEALRLIGRFEVEYRVERADGAVQWVHERGAVVPGTEGRRALGFIEDLTDRRTLEGPLQKISADLPERFEEALDALLDLVIEETGARMAFLGMLDAEDESSVSTVEARDRGGPMDNFVYDLVGSPCENVFGNRLCCYPRDVADLFPLDAALRESGTEGYLGVPLSSPSGQVLAILVATFDQPIEDETRARTLFRVCGERLGAAMAAREAQEALGRATESLERAVQERTHALAEANHRLRTTQERYRVFVQRSSVGIWCLEVPEPIPLDLDPEEQRRRITEGARLVECNDTVALRLGAPSGASLTGLALSDVPTFWHEETQSSLAETIVRGYELTDVARSVSLPDGSVRHLRADLVPIFEDGGLVRLWCTERDVTARVIDEENAAHHISRLMHFSRLNTLGEMAAGIAHELNQPLAAIVNYARGSLRRLGEDADPELLAAQNAIAEQAEHAGASLRRLRGFSTADSHDSVPCSASQIVRDAVKSMVHRQRACRAEFELRLDLAEDEVQADAIQIEQVLVQLLRNTCDILEADPELPRLVRISLRQTPRGVEIEVRDWGPGLAPFEATHAFDPFFSGRDGGVGIGLAVSRSVIESHGGRLWHETPTDGAGAAFRFTLPRPSEKIGS